MLAPCVKEPASKKPAEGSVPGAHYGSPQPEDRAQQPGSRQGSEAPRDSVSPASPPFSPATIKAALRLHAKDVDLLKNLLKQQSFSSNAVTQQLESLRAKLQAQARLIETLVADSQQHRQGVGAELVSLRGLALQLRKDCDVLQAALTAPATALQLNEHTTRLSSIEDKLQSALEQPASNKRARSSSPPSRSRSRSHSRSRSPTPERSPAPELTETERLRAQLAEANTKLAKQQENGKRPRDRDRDRDRDDRRNDSRPIHHPAKKGNTKRWEPAPDEAGKARQIASFKAKLEQLEGKKK